MCSLSPQPCCHNWGFIIAESNSAEGILYNNRSRVGNKHPHVAYHVSLASHQYLYYVCNILLNYTQTIQSDRRQVMQYQVLVVITYVHVGSMDAQSYTVYDVVWKLKGFST